MTTTTTAAVVGIDVGKTRLDASSGGREVHPFPNDDPGIAALLAWLTAQPVALVVCEPTGGYEGPLVHRLAQAGLPVHLAHPNKVRAFAQASGRQAKTDRLDAQVLSQYGQAFALQESPPPDPQREELQSLLRRQLVNQRVQERNRLDRAWNPATRASTQRHIDWLDAEIARLDRDYQDALESSEHLCQQAILYRSVPGVGPLTAATLVADLPELGYGDSKGLCALAGLAPWARDSGQQRGHRAIRGGRPAVRRALYMSALSIVRTEGQLRQVLPGSAPAGQAWQSGPRSGHAQAPDPTPRHRPTRHTLDTKSHTGPLNPKSSRTLDIQHGYSRGSGHPGLPGCAHIPDGEGLWVPALGGMTSPVGPNAIALDAVRRSWRGMQSPVGCHPESSEGSRSKAGPAVRSGLGMP